MNCRSTKNTLIGNYLLINLVLTKFVSMIFISELTCVSVVCLFFVTLLRNDHLAQPLNTHFRQYCDLVDVFRISNMQNKSSIQYLLKHYTLRLPCLQKHSPYIHNLQSVSSATMESQRYRTVPWQELTCTAYLRHGIGSVSRQ